MFIGNWVFSGKTARAGLTTTVLVSAGLLMSGCGDNTAADSLDNTAAPTTDNPTEEQGLPAPEFGSDDTVELPIALVSPPGINTTDPLDDQGRPLNSEGAVAGVEPHQIEVARSEEFGCADTLSVIQTVPLVTENPAISALDYLLNTENSTHGDPVLSNALASAPEGLIESVTEDDGVVAVNLTEAPQLTDACQAAQILGQLEVTARATTGADSVHILVDGTPLHEVWGVPELPELSLTIVNR